MRNLYIILFVFISFQTYGQFVKGSIYASNYDITVKVKPTGSISYAMGSPFGFNITVSVDSNGQPIENAPAPTSISCYITGVVVNYVGVHLEDGRFIYTFTLTGNAGSAGSWPADVEQNLVLIDFPENPILTGQFPRLEDQTNDGGGPSLQSYFYADINGVDYTDYSEFFYVPVGGSLGTYGDGDQYVQSGTALPIRLLSFHASKAGERSALLQWTTTSEINSDFFDIERSTDGITWETIGNVKAAGYSQEQQEYKFLDDALPLTRSELLLYYRLRLVDADGRYDFSEVKGVNFRSLPLGELSIYPNPAYDMLHVDFTGMEAVGSGTIEIYDNSGKSVFTRKGDTQGILLLDITDFAAGTYYVNYSGQAGIIRKSFIKVQR